MFKVSLMISIFLVCSTSSDPYSKVFNERGAVGAYMGWHFEVRLLAYYKEDKPKRSETHHHLQNHTCNQEI